MRMSGWDTTGATQEAEPEHSHARPIGPLIRIGELADLSVMQLTTLVHRRVWLGDSTHGEGSGR
ncbi:MAG: hypothetical protein DRJ50_00865 [Actinobacteria bacterium]|nr:MAG: hypothetical protein DRJ50_00865 [Actinomycetota bacterium]